MAGVHYEIVSSWWKQHNWPVIPLSHLPQLGFVSFIDDIAAAAGWLYQTDSAFCIFEWIVVNPEIRREKRTLALNALIKKAKEAAKVMEFETIFMSVRHAPLVSRLEKHGFVPRDQHMTNLVYSNLGSKQNG